MFDINNSVQIVEGSLAVKTVEINHTEREFAGDKAIKKIKAHWLRLIKLEQEAVNKMAVRMYLSGFPKEYIRLKLKIDMVYLDDLIKNISRNVEDTAVYLYFWGYSIEKICCDLYIEKYMLKQWIREVYKRNRYRALREKPKIQDGFTPWVSQILDKQMKDMGLSR